MFIIHGILITTPCGLPFSLDKAYIFPQIIKTGKTVLSKKDFGITRKITELKPKFLVNAILYFSFYISVVSEVPVKFLQLSAASIHHIFIFPDLLSTIFYFYKMF